MTIRQLPTRPKAAGAALAIWLLAFFTATAFAGLTQNDVTGAGGFVTAYGGLTSGGNPDPGFDPEVGFNQVNIDEDSFTGAGLSSAAISFSQAPHINSGAGMAGQGFIDFTASSESMYDFATSFHSNAWIHAGWSDRIVISAPGFTGETAIWLFRVNVSAAFAASGFAGSPRVELRPYLDHDGLPGNLSGVDLGDSDPVSTSDQHAEWGLVLSFIGASQTRTVDDTVTFAAEIVIGEPFDLGIYALAIAGARNSSAYPTMLSTADVQSAAVTWGGSAGLSVAGAPVPGFTVTADSGSDWLQAIPVADFDSDGLANSGDNCVLRANPGQQDSDGDGIGNLCDPDIAPLTNDCVVNIVDLAAIKSAFFSTPPSPDWNPDADFDSNSIVNTVDLGTMKAHFFQAPGPSGVVNACP